MAVADELKLPVESVHLRDGRHGQGPVRHGDLRQPDHADDGPPDAPGGRRGAGPAAGPGGRAVRASIAVRSSLADGKVVHAATGKSAGFGELTHGRKLVETIGDETPTMPAGRVEGRRPVGPQDRWPRLRDRQAPLHDATSSGPACSGARSSGPRLSGRKLASLDTSRAEAMPDVKVVRDGDFVGVVAPSECCGHARPGRAPADLDCARRARHVRQGPRGLPQGRIPSRETAAPGIARRSENGSVKDELAAAHDQGRGGLHGRLHRPRPAGAAGGRGRVGGRTAHRLDRHPAPLRRRGPSWRRRSTCPRTGPRASSPTPAAATAASTPARPRSRRPGWPRRRASR